MEDPKLRIIRNLKNPNNNRKKPKNFKKGSFVGNGRP